MILDYFPYNSTAENFSKARAHLVQMLVLIYLDKLEFTFLRRLDNPSRYRILLRVLDKITTQYPFRFCFWKEYPSIYAFYLMTFSSILSTKYVIEG